MSIYKEVKLFLLINDNNLSYISKIYYISLIKQFIDLLNDENENDEQYNLLTMLEKKHELYEKYWIYDDLESVYFYDYMNKIPKTFLTYINEIINNYLSIDDLKVKIIIIENLLEIPKFVLKQKENYEHINFNELKNKLNIYKNNIK